jgi:hypothetical protein
MNVQTRELGNPVVNSLLAEDTREFLRAALEIAQQKEAIRLALLARLLASLRERLSGWELTGTPLAPDDGLAIIPPDAQDWFFCVELDSRAGRWCYGLKLLRPNGRKSKAMFNLGTRLRDRFQGAEGPNDHWLIWLWFDNRTAHDPASYLQWEENVQPWVDMADGTMAANLVALATELREVATELR